MTDAPIQILDTATKFEASHCDAVVVCGSHGGVYPAYLAATRGLARGDLERCRDRLEQRRYRLSRLLRGAWHGGGHRGP